MNKLFLSTVLTMSLLGSVHAETFSVNSSEDLPDYDLDGICDALDGPGIKCTLRAAVMEANDTPVQDTITLSGVPGAQVNLDLDVPEDGTAATGDIDIFEHLVITGASELIPGNMVTIDSSQIGASAFSVQDDNVTVSFDHIRFVNGNANAPSSSSGGAISAGPLTNVAIDSVIFENNRADVHGGAVASFGADITITQSHFQGNRLSVGAGTGGAAIAMIGTDPSTLSVQRSSFTLNDDESATERSVIWASGEVNVELENVFLDGNSQDQHGVYVEGALSLTARNVTIVNNGNAGVLSNNVAANGLFISNSILAGNGADCVVIGGFDPSDTENFNLIEDGTCSPTGNNLSGPPNLGPFVSVEGIVPKWRTPLAGSNAIDAGAPSLDILPMQLLCSPVDIRGIARGVDGDSDGVARCDIGAVEASLESHMYVVNRIDLDAPDVLLGDGHCDSGFLAGDQCTLRAAVEESNALLGSDLIELPAGATISLTRAGPGSDDSSASTGDLDIAESTQIYSSDATQPVTIQWSGADQNRIFDVSTDDGEVVFNGLILTGGYAQGGSAGAIRIQNSDVEVRNTRIVGNFSVADEAAIRADASHLVLLNVDVAGNYSHAEGSETSVVGVMSDSSVILNRVSMRDNGDPAAGAAQSALRVDGSAQVFNSTFSNNAGTAIDARPSGIMDVVQTTIVGDGPGQRGITILGSVDGASFSLVDSIVSASLEDCSYTATAGVFSATFMSNVMHHDPCTNESAESDSSPKGVGVLEDPLLGPLQLAAEVADQPTLTWLYVPQQGSPAIDRRIVQAGLLVPYDQQKNPRPVASTYGAPANAIDAGSVEIQSQAIFRDGFEDEGGMACKLAIDSSKGGGVLCRK